MVAFWAVVRLSAIDESESEGRQTDPIDPVCGRGSQCEWQTSERLADVVEAVAEGDLPFGFDGADEFVRAIFHGR